jgi:predicted metal-dependent enzyme (double-stranded beta helix superfamily)
VTCNFVERIQSILAKGKVDKVQLNAILDATRDFMPNFQQELCDQDWEPGRYMLYKDSRYGFVVMMLVWGKGDKTPIHAHGTWGVEAIIKNSVRVTTYTYCQKNPIELTCSVLNAGELAFVIPPDDDVHVVAQEGDLPAISVHIYGKELTENIIFSPGQGFRPSPVTCRRVQTKIFEKTNWFQANAHISSLQMSR